jgi:hypothetical protein
MLLARSQPCKLHFKDQRLLIVLEKVMSAKSKRLRSVEGMTHSAERRESHGPDTDRRLLTEMNRSRMCRRP